MSVAGVGQTGLSHGAFKIRDLQNTGDIDLVFVTVEFLDSGNAPLEIPASVRMNQRDCALQAA
jgi:hypothetical protein